MIIGIIKAAVQNWQMFLLAAGMASILVVGVYLKGRVDGYEKRDLEQAAAEKQVKEAARAEIIRIENEHKKTIRKILSRPDNGITCPYATDAIKRLYDSPSGSQ